MTPERRRVVKVGGSLLTWSQLPQQLDGWLKSESPMTSVLIAGGGPWAELLRQTASRFDLAEAAAHDMCIQAMSVTASLLADLLSCPCATSLAELSRIADCDRVVLDVHNWLAGERSRDLPKSWDVTSDSIAARLASELNAVELVLLKSRSAPGRELSSLADAGYVDRYFSNAAANLSRIRYVNLRERTGGDSRR